uniref:TatD related DNase n=1 Tax=Chromera velia CCMP2878 TaxID=1169474 RepID=A0A0G4F759_9ALVE|eukprot:Cvel_15578.t1-p1 / transcript=Cvel_15578.t1 / gene=Cvel_15578 / organism=Chromera_velia_CCMP2878 / gene_product=Putative deoxyribonuclease TATDN1, putative / transcript_product=Putative deoxyribonuclease TATDN1, putative / location=Cvel_scaffold1158:30792-32726(-) / protein_length=315 / sequence_SO=supercontig / SO=protein_coding / is_pseudo=false
MSTAVSFIDIAVNLGDSMFQGWYNGKQKHEPDLKLVMERAKKAGVQKMLVTGGSLSESEEVIRLCRDLDPDRKQLFCTVGVHPTRCGEFESDPEGHISKLRELIQNNLDVVAAVGEMGLDADRVQFCAFETQEKFFELQLNLVEECELPMFLHMRAACTPFLDILKRNRKKWEGVGGVVHSFTDSLTDAEAILSEGLYIGLNGCSLKTEENLEVVSKIPVDKLMLETDAPWCDIRLSHASSKHVKTLFESKKPEKFEEGVRVKGRNEPSGIVQVAEAVLGAVNSNSEGSHGRELTLEDLARQAEENTLRVFDKLK